MSKSRKKKRPRKRVMALPDLEQSKAAVLTLLPSKSFTLQDLSRTEAVRCHGQSISVGCSSSRSI